MTRKERYGLAILLLVASSLPQPSAGQSGQLLVELNKLEAGDDGGCRSFFLFRNGLDYGLDGFEMSLAVLDPDGVIDRLLTIDAAPVPAQRTTLRLFDIPETACADVSEIILHDIPVCSADNGQPTECFDVIELRSRAEAALVR